MNEKSSNKPDININLVLPEFYYKATDINNGDRYSDKKWIANALNAISESARLGCATKYSLIYNEAFNKELVMHTKSNSARFHANCFLRGYLDDQILIKKSAIYLPQPKSWEIIAHLRLFQNDHTNFHDWAEKYKNHIQAQRY